MALFVKLKSIVKAIPIIPILLLLSAGLSLEGCISTPSTAVETSLLSGRLTPMPGERFHRIALSMQERSYGLTDGQIPLDADLVNSMRLEKLGGNGRSLSPKDRESLSRLRRAMLQRLAFMLRNISQNLMKAIQEQSNGGRE